MDTYHVVLYIHLLALFVGIGAAAVLLSCLTKLRNAETLADAVPWGTLAGQVEKAFPIAVLGLFATGAYMTSDVWAWSTRWIDVSIVALVILALQGPLVGGRAGHRLKQALQENGPGPLSDATRKMARNPGLWVTELTNIGLVFGVVWDMTEKPGTGAAIAAPLIGYVAGALLAYPLTRLDDAPRAAEHAS
ncbi:MAG TPA: hypothetical protein VGH52_06115 [Gaiellaceae bacterium]